SRTSLFAIPTPRTPAPRAPPESGSPAGRPWTRPPAGTAPPREGAPRAAWPLPHPSPRSASPSRRTESSPGTEPWLPPCRSLPAGWTLRPTTPIFALVRYIGNKTRLLGFIRDVLDRRGIDGGTAVDPF